MTKTSKKSFDPQLLKDLLKSAEGKELFGKPGFFQQLKESLVNEALQAEMDHHLGYERHSREEKNDENRRNGHFEKQVLEEQRNDESHVYPAIGSHTRRGHSESFH